MKVMSLKYVQEFKSEDMIKELAMHLMKTERNFILEKGQTTVSIEKDRLQNLSDSKLTNIISEIIKLKQNELQYEDITRPSKAFLMLFNYC